MRRHVKKRADQRYEIKLTKDDLRDITAKIRSGDSVPIDCPNNTLNKRRHKVTFNGQDIIVVYHKKYKELVTVLL